jgi:hypothetical protein
MSISRIAVIEEVEVVFAHIIQEPDDALSIADEVLEIYHMLIVMEYLGPNSEAYYMSFAMEAYYHACISTRGDMFLDKLQRDYRAYINTYTMKAH